MPKFKIYLYCGIRLNLRIEKMKKSLAMLALMCSVAACQRTAVFPDEDEELMLNAPEQAISEPRPQLKPQPQPQPKMQRVEYVDEEGNVLEVRNEPVAPLPHQPEPQPREHREIRYQEVEPQLQVLAPSGNYGLEYRDAQEVNFEANIDPKVYAIVARRVLNKMLDETAPLYETKEDEIPSIYIRDIKIYDDRLPDGFYQAHKETQKLLENSHTFKLTNNKYEADYFLETEIDTLEIKDYDSPVIIYRLILLDQRNGVIKEWKENIRRVRNDDRSWW